MKNNIVLLAEDDPNFGSVLRDYLELNDFDVVLATDGIERYAFLRPKSLLIFAFST
jgi:DNA-binding response OmpR family regulator